MKKWVSNNIFLIIIIIAILSRLPQLTGANLFLDGDECIIGLMSLHFFEGIELPFFFYGQSYGFTFIEVIFITIGYAFFGMSDIVIKASVLLLWIIGAFFFYKTIYQISPREQSWLPLMLTLVFITAPVWTIWSMKARGGYLTAFAIANLTTYLLLSTKWSNRSVIQFLAGILIVIVYQSQPIWLSGLIPILIYSLYKTKKIRPVIYTVTGIISAYFLFLLPKINLKYFWEPKQVSVEYFDPETLTAIPLRIYQNFTGSYSYNTFIQPFITTQIVAFILTILLFLCFVWLIYCLIARMKINILAYIFSISSLATIGITLFLNTYSPRYLIPLFGYTCLTIYAIISNQGNKKYVVFLMGGLILLGMISMYSFKNFRVEQVEKEDLKTLIEELEKNDIHHIYCRNGLLQWKIMFYSKERIIARYITRVDRYPKYIDLVDNALQNRNEKVAMVGYFKPYIKTSIPEAVEIKESFYYVEEPKQEFLKEKGFELTTPY